MKKNEVKLVSLFLILFITNISIAQDLHLTQYLTSNLSLNPAYSGYYDGDYRITVNHRNQWRQLPSPMLTNKFSVEKRIENLNREYGIGLLVANDIVSDVNLSSSKIALSGAYQINKNDHLIRAGLQTGLSLRQSNFGDQTFPNQWNYELGVFDQNTSSSELSLSPSYMFLDVNLGVSWTKIYNKWKLNAGVAAFHLNRPKNGFVDGSSELRLPVRKTINLRADYMLSDKITLTPNMLLMMTTKTQDLLFGLMGKYDLSNDVYVGLAVNYRGEVKVSDAIIPTFMLGYKRVQFGFSNDYNISSLSDKVSKKTSYEFSLIYTTSSATPSRVAIPCQRI